MNELDDRNSDLDLDSKKKKTASIAVQTSPRFLRPSPTRRGGATGAVRFEADEAFPATEQDGAEAGFPLPLSSPPPPLPTPAPRAQPAPVPSAPSPPPPTLRRSPPARPPAPYSRAPLVPAVAASSSSSSPSSVRGPRTPPGADHQGPPPPSRSEPSPAPLAPWSFSLSTAGLAPFRYALPSRSSRSSPSSKTARATAPTTAAAEPVWVELLPASHGGEGGDVVLDSRTRDGRVWVFSSDGGEVTLFRPPPPPPLPFFSSRAGPLVLLHSLRTFRAGELFSPSPSSEEKENEAEVDVERKAARRAWRKVEAVLTVVRSRTVLMTFHPPLSLLTPPSTSTSLLPSPVAPSPRPKCTIFSDGGSPPSPTSTVGLEPEPEPASYALSFSFLTVNTNTGGKSTRVELYVSPAREVVRVSVSTTAAAAAGHAGGDDGEGGSGDRKKTWTGRLCSTSSSSSPSSRSSHASLESFLASSLPHCSSASSSVADLAHLILTHLAVHSSALGRTVERVRRAHLEAIHG
ncbi:hypothetical protein JCM6882_002745 [Rhodosporidiobolus microsporus]